MKLKFTKHASQQLKERGISKELVKLAIERGSKSRQGKNHFILTYTYIKVAYKKYQMNEEVASLQMEIAKLRQEKNDLMSSIQSVNDQSFLETEARRRLNLQKEGEQVVFLKKTEGAESKKLVEQNATSTQTEIDKQESNLSKWWRYFFK